MEIKKISINEEGYPELLRKIPNPPKIIYVQGVLISKENRFAVVGTRRYSSYGKQVAMDLSGDLSEAGLIIVSGLAPGIDTFSHQAVIERNKRTIAVLGTGIDEKSLYPKSNIKLARKIIETGGCLISEYPEGMRGTRFTFPQRNRIISGLSLGVLVVEAKIKSGSLITAEEAFRQKRKVFAVPGQIYSPNSAGCHFLLKKGAILADSADDIIRELSIPKLPLEKKFAFDGNPEEVLILKCLKEGGLHIDRVIEKTKLPAKKVVGLLSILEIKGKVKNLGANIYAISNR